MIRLGLAGCGEVGRYICQNLDQIGVEYELLAYDRNPEKVDRACGISDKIRPCHHMSELLNEPLDFFIEAASREFAKEHGAAFLENGVNLITVSNGFLAIDHIREHFLQCAEKGNAKIYIPSGPPGMDAALGLQIYGIKNAKYTSLRNSKHPIAAEVGIGNYFSGTVREAMVFFNKTLNTSAVLAEATIGYDASLAEVGFYDEVEGYELRLNVDTDIAQLDVCLKGKLHSETRKFHYFAALSVVALLKKLHSRLVIGI